jgi:hypothetical protein
MTESFPLKTIEFEKDSIQADLLKYGGDVIDRNENTENYVDEVNGSHDRKKWEDRDSVHISTKKTSGDLRDGSEVEEITYMPGLGTVRISWDYEGQKTTVFIPEDRVHYMTYFD